MSYCVNPECPNPKNAADAFLCQACNARLLVRNRYRVTKSLGQGGFGATFVATDVSLPGEPVCVIKQLRPSNSHEKFLRMARELFEREARTLGKIGNHPQVPRLLDYFEERKNFYLVQDFISGHTVHQEVKQTGLFNEKKIRDFLLDILPAIGYIHSQQVIHRDIKPANIIRRDFDGKLVLIDFGAVKNNVAQLADMPEAGGDGSNANTQFAVGTSGYAPPEQLAMRPVYASDIYALAVTCIYLMTGKSPKDIEYNPQTGAMMWQKHVQLGKHMSYVLSRMLEVSVRDRYQTAQETIDALNNESIGERQIAPAQPVRQQTSASQPGVIGQVRHPGMPPAPPPVQPTAPSSAQNATMSATQRMAERIKKQKDLTGIRNGDPTKIDAGASTGFNPGSSPAPTVRRPLQKMDAPAVLNAFKKGQRTFNDIDLSNLQLPGAHLPGITLVKANCTQSNFQGANLAAGKFESANFSDAVLRDASLSKTYFSHANLQNADLRGADLSDAYLKFANLQGTNLCGANLKGVNVTEEQLSTAKTNFMTVFPNGKRGGFW